VILLYGCATADEVYVQDGRLGYNISCDGMALSMRDCMQKASDLCGARGYDVYNADGQAIPFGYSTGGAGYNAYGDQAGYTTTAGAIVTRDLMVACR
jgi:arabinogalactan endo-1,4-beta-galactosidase